MFDINAIITSAIAKEVHLIVAPLASRIAELEEANTVLVERLNAVQPTPPCDELPEDYFKRDALTNAFVEKLNDQEWFWNKVNGYIRDGIERYGEPMTSEEVTELFATQWQRRVGANDLLGRDEVADVVRELWADEFEDEVRDVAERAIEDIDLSDIVRREVRDLSFSVSVD